MTTHDDSAAIERIGLRLLRSSEEERGARVLRASIVGDVRLNPNASIVVVHYALSFSDAPSREIHRCRLGLVVAGAVRSSLSIGAEQLHDVAALLLEVARRAAFETRERERNAGAW